MRKIFGRISAWILTMALLMGLSVSAFALEIPQAYWALQTKWLNAVEAQDLEGILTTAEETYQLFKDYPLDADLCGILQTRCARASWAAEMLGDAKTALLWQERELVVDKWFNDNGVNYGDLILNGNARMDYLRAAIEPTIYTLTDTPTNYGAGAPALGTLYGTNEGGSQTSESAVLVYVNFLDGYSMEYWMNYFNNTSPKLKKATQNGGVIELAWNLSPENTAGAQKVLDSSADSYINESLATLGALNCTVLLRFGAEMNNWDCDPQTYIDAFQKVADVAHRYSNIEMVFSPNDISNRNNTFELFYPGDAYVDWFGVSTYHSTNYKSFQSSAKGTYSFDDKCHSDDAFYGTGIYDSDPLIVIGPIARFAQEHGKPMMISECGFLENNYGENQSAYSADQVNKLYSYANMIYPNIKALFYFDVSIGGNDYRFNNNPSVAAAYHKAIAENGGYIREGETTGKNWERLDQDARFYQRGQVVKLATYASFPGEEATTVRYYVDGALKATTTEVPYALELNTAELAYGEHTVKAVASNGQFTSETANYKIAVSLSELPFIDVIDPFYLEPISWAADNQVVRGVTETLFAPDRTCTNGEILTMIWRAAGYPTPTVDICKDEDFYRDPVNWAYGENMITGDAAPFDPCSRAQVVTYLWRAAGSPQVTTTVQFDDIPANAPYTAAVAWALENGITNGTKPGKFSPDNTCTRAQVATFLFRYFGE